MWAGDHVGWLAPDTLQLAYLVKTALWLKFGSHAVT